MKIILISESDTFSFSRKISFRLDYPFNIYLNGQLGIGKTTMTKGLLKSLGYRRNVNSPTFSLLKEYQVDNIKIYHLDLYRIRCFGKTH